MGQIVPFMSSIPAPPVCAIERFFQAQRLGINYRQVGVENVQATYCQFVRWRVTG